MKREERKKCSLSLKRKAEREGSFSLQAQRRERKMPSKKKRKPENGAPTDIPSPQVQIGAHCAASPVSWGCESGGRGRMVERETESRIFLPENYVVLGYFQPGPYPTRTWPVPGIFFFWKKWGTPGVRMQRYPGCTRTSAVPGTGTAPKLPYPCFIAKHWNLRPDYPF